MSLGPRAGGADSETVLAPFIVQRGGNLFFIALEPAGWVVAELRFDLAPCAYAEVRRMRYDWPREAFGALLSRVAVVGEVDPGIVDETSRDFLRWLSAQFRARDEETIPRA
ncbi:MAG: hypothetical protein QM589_19205 [Thermomicrobiales bacterium]